MAAFVIVRIGTARDLARAISAAFPTALQLSACAWIVAADDDATAASITRQIDLTRTRDAALVIRVDLNQTHGLADDATWRFIEQAARYNKLAKSSLYD
ncbi:hypothetical protein AMST5_03601 [freshwater sediment metagenome]|uniref:Uncharacterized protein n=1 Tax=freshwater sediment metagenome TaxID=556182 RepID=A0AA48M3D5_9ZZZZ